MKPGALLRWQSSADPTVVALEWLARAPSPAELRRGLGALAARDGCPAFVLVAAQAGGVAAAAELQRALPPSTRLVLAAERDALDDAADRLFAAGDVGLLLDGVDLDTPMRAVVHPRVEAIRFRPEFVLDAERDLRAGCALDAMIGLARACGLATLGPARAPNDQWLAPESAFDLVPSYRIGPSAGETLGVVAGERTADGFQLSR